MRKYSAVFLVLFWPSLIYAVEIKLPETVKGEVGDYIKVPSTTTGTQVRWVALDKGLKVFPVELLKDSKTAIVSSNLPGSYRLLAYTAERDVPSDPVICLVVVGDVPPGPVPPGPIPEDPFIKSLKEAYLKETDIKKGEQKAALAALYRQGAEFAQKADVTTWGALFSAMSSAASTMGLSGKLLGVQKVIQAELAKLPTERQRPLDDSGRELAKKTFGQIATALEEVK